MKNTIIKSFLTLLPVLLCNTAILAQVTVIKDQRINDYEPPQFEALDFSTFTINGLEMAGPEYTEQDIIRAFGQPDTVEFDEFGYTFLIGRDLENCRYAAEITLYSKPKGPIMTAYVFDGKYNVNGFIRVGDHISKVYEMDGDFSNTQYHKNCAGAIFWRPTGTGWENVEFFNCPEFTYDEDGVITSIGFWSF